MKQQQLMGLFRHVLTALGGIVVANGTTDDATIQQVVGAAMVIAGFVWSLIEKRNSASKAATPPVVLGFILMALGFAFSGCGTITAKPVDANKWAADYYKQDPTFVAFELTGVSKIEGTNIHMVARSYRPPLTVIPKEPGIVDKICDLGKWITGAYFGAQVLDKAFTQPRTVSPEVVRPEVVVVQ